MKIGWKERDRAVKESKKRHKENSEYLAKSKVRKEYKGLQKTNKKGIINKEKHVSK